MLLGVILSGQAHCQSETNAFASGLTSPGYSSLELAPTEHVGAHEAKYPIWSQVSHQLFEWPRVTEWVSQGLSATSEFTYLLLHLCDPVVDPDDIALPAAYQHTDFSGFYLPLVGEQTGFYLSADFEEPGEMEREFHGDVLSLEGGGGFTYALDDDLSLRWGVNGRFLSDQELDQGRNWDFDVRSSVGITYQF